MPAISADAPAKIGPGRLVLVVGPSGAGKDTLLNLARAICAGDPGIMFPRRVVTREASSSEDNAYLSLDAFRQARARGDFALHWEAHGHCYGVPRALDDDIRSGRTAVVNVSRMVIEAVRRAYTDAVVVLVTAPPAVLAERLATRVRDSDGRIEARLGRVVDDAIPDVTIVNVGDADAHALRLVGVIRAFSSGVDTGSREENASKQESRASVLIQSEPKML
jgi:ribose 1,5-bisphosphokinase